MFLLHVFYGEVVFIVGLSNGVQHKQHNNLLLEVVREYVLVFASGFAREGPKFMILLEM